MAIVVQHPKISASQTKKGSEDMPIGDSSFLQQVTYDAGSLQMTVIMKNGGTYIYSSVSPDVMSDFTESRDKSSFYANAIRGKYPGSRIVNKTTGKAGKKT